MEGTSTQPYRAEAAYLRQMGKRILYIGWQLPVVGVWNTQLSITTNGFIKIQNFLLPLPRQLLVGCNSNCRTKFLTLM